MQPLTPCSGIMDVKPYVAGQSSIPGVMNIIKLSSNEGTIGPCPRAVEAYKQAAGEIFRYPDGSAAALREAIGAQYSIDPSRIVCSAGSDEMISLLCQAYVRPGDEVLCSQYGFLMYFIYAKVNGATPVKAKEKFFTTDVDAILDAVTDKTSVVFLANPNNPTGTYISASEIKRLREGLPERILLVIDSAYAEYVTLNDYTSSAELVHDSENTVMLRTFSKIYGLGGIRLGWSYCPESIASVLNRCRSPFNVSVPAQAAGAAAMRDVAFVNKVREHNDKWRPVLADGLRKLGIDVVPSVCNFVLARFLEEKGMNSVDADNYLRSKGVIARRVDAYDLKECLRITVGTGEEVHAVLGALKEYVESL